MKKEMKTRKEAVAAEEVSSMEMRTSRLWLLDAHMSPACIGGAAYLVAAPRSTTAAQKQSQLLRMVVSLLLHAADARCITARSASASRAWHDAALWMKAPPWLWRMHTAVMPLAGSCRPACGSKRRHAALTAGSKLRAKQRHKL
jgi:hypothetical protein